MLEHAKSVASLLKRNQGVWDHALTVAEIGVWTATTSADLFRRFPKLTMWLVDHYQRYMRFSSGRQLEHLKIALANTHAYRRRRKFLIMESAEAAELVEDGSLDLVFIDGSHDYEAVRDDIVAWAPKLTGTFVDGNGYHHESILCGHDYSADYPGVQTAVDEWAQENNRELGFLPGTVWWARGGP